MSSLSTGKLKLSIVMALCGLSIWANAQSVPSPGPVQTKPILLRGVTIHVGDGSASSQGDVLIVKGKIAEIGAQLQTNEEAEIIECAGKHLYPGLIAPVATLGLTEIEAVRSTNDQSEVGPINPNVRAIVAYNTDSRVTPTLRSNGILLAQITPDGGLLKGTSSVVQLDAWSWEDAVYRLDDAVHLDWPSHRFATYPGAPPREEQEKRMKDRKDQIETAMLEARAYANEKESAKPAAIDLRWEAMLPIIKKEKALWISADAEKDIRSAVEFAIRQDIKMVLVGGADAWLLSDLLRLHQIPVVLRKPQSLPRTEDDAVDLPYNTPKILYRAGILSCLSIDNFWNYRNLPFQAGQTVATGLSKEEALQMVTLNAAKILGIDERTGSIAVGKDANLVLSTGDLLDMRSSKVEAAWIQGRRVDLGNKQKDLNVKFLEKYGLEELK